MIEVKFTKTSYTQLYTTIIFLFIFACSDWLLKSHMWEDGSVNGIQILVYFLGFQSGQWGY